MYYIYYLQSKKDKNHTYIGYTADLVERVERHNNELVLSTKPYKPWKLIFYEAYLNKADAKRREEYLKTTKGRKTLKFMLRDSL